MAQAFISYYEHLAKLAQIANKQTVFLAHVLANMEFHKESRQYSVDMSTAKKAEIMTLISPNIPKDKLLANANQYLNKLMKAGMIKNVGRGVWLVDPTCYGQHRVVSGSLRKDNKVVYETYKFTKDGLESVVAKNEQ